VRSSIANILAVGAGVVCYAVVGTIFGMGALGVGFMPEPERTFWGHVIVFAPLLVCGYVVGWLSHSRSGFLAALLGVVALAIDAGLAGAPVPFILRDLEGPLWVTAAQFAYQAVWNIALAEVGAWLGTKWKTTPRPV
jgi:hypothetical protein